MLPPLSLFDETSPEQLCCGEAWLDPSGVCAFYSTLEDDTLEGIAEKFGKQSSATEIWAANRHRSSLKGLARPGGTKVKTRFSAYTCLCVPLPACCRGLKDQADGGPAPSTKTEQRARALQVFSRAAAWPPKLKPCAQCRVAGVVTARHCREFEGHLVRAPFDALPAVGDTVRVRWIDEDSHRPLWYYATVTHCDEKEQQQPNKTASNKPTTRHWSVRVAYEEGGSSEELAWPSPDAVKCDDAFARRPGVSPAQQAFVDQRLRPDSRALCERELFPLCTDAGLPATARLVVLDVFDSLEEGVDCVQVELALEDAQGVFYEKKKPRLSRECFFF